jgi:aminoglycoside N3'-acetyltransferase
MHAPPYNRFRYRQILRLERNYITGFRIARCSGSDSPLERFMMLDDQIVLQGSDHHAVTFLHIG